MNLPFWTIHRSGLRTILGITGELLGSAEPLLGELADADRIELVLDSIGGDTELAFKLHEGLKGRVVSTDVIRASSAAVLLLCCGGHVRAERAGVIMLHGPTTLAFGSVEDLRTRAASLEQTIERMTAILIERTEANLETVRQWLAGPDYWFTSQQALEVGLCDELFDLPVIAPEAVAEGPEARAAVQDDGPFLLSLLEACGRIRIRNRAAFARNLSVWMASAIQEATSSGALLTPEPCARAGAVRLVESGTAGACASPCAAPALSP